ncbi:FAD-dependent oxidoreductase [Glutamicibacter sp. PS]|uniref:FAD-dependent oxidoreductase n=1 Tax=Glutamicibacter sp. PS TaxID=3075634 RepID=UPI0028411A49|nr:FAD-dependent oxidoreductase [Glutamicibacter sp. PS]MDR4532616.1 FAD-dependent oxidoreductase [Glutamicibacter sp. PS]
MSEITIPEHLTSRALRVAIVGAGPAGIYAADLLAKSQPVASGELGLKVDLFDELPTPFGLIRYGVSPDHPRIKGIINALHKVLNNDWIDFYGNVGLGRDITLAELKERYDAVIIATGAQKDADLNIPGIDLEGSFGGADFVSWYDAHPDVDKNWDLSAKEVAVIGNGNVALDVARILSKHADQLIETEIPAHIYEQLNNSAVTDVHVFGRRGPAQVKFTPLELRELSHSKDVDIVLYPEDFEFDKASDEAMKTNNQTKTMVSTLTNWLIEQEEREDAPSASRRLHLHFLQSPVEILGEDGKVAGLKVERNELDGTGNAKGTGEFIEYPLQAVYRAVGYFGSAVDDIEYDGAKGVLPNVEGRVQDAEGNFVPGLYATGWIKRGPVGLIGHTKGDALETITHLLEDLTELAVPASEQTIAELLTERGVDYADWSGWLALDEQEKALGAQAGTVETRFGEVTRDRIKVVERGEMLEFARAKKLAESL